MPSKEASSWKRGFLVRDHRENNVRLRNQSPNNNTDLLSLDCKTQEADVKEARDRPFLLVSSSTLDGADDTLGLGTQAERNTAPELELLLQVNNYTSPNAAEPHIRQVSTRKKKTDPLQTSTNGTPFTLHDLTHPNNIETCTVTQVNQPILQDDNNNAATVDTDHSIGVRQQWKNQLFMALLRIRQSLANKQSQQPGAAQQGEHQHNLLLRFSRCQKIADHFIDQIIQSEILASTSNDDTQPTYDGLLYNIWDYILPSIGEIRFQDIPLNFSITTPQIGGDDTHVNFYGICAEPHILTLPPTFFIAFSLLQHDSGQGWISIFRLGQRIYKQAFHDPSSQAKSMKLQLLGLSSIVILQTHMILASFFISHDVIHNETNPKSYQQLLYNIIPFIATQGLALLVDLSCISSEHGQRNTLLASKAQEASTSLVELIAFYMLAAGGYHPTAQILPNLPTHFNLETDKWAIFYDSFERLIDLSRTLALTDKYKNVAECYISDCGVSTNSPAHLWDKLDPSIHCRLALINFWMALVKRLPGPKHDMFHNCSIKDSLMNVFREISLSSNSSTLKVGRLTCDLCRMSRFPRPTADAVVEDWPVKDDEKYDESSTDSLVKWFCLALSHKGSSLNLRHILRHAKLPEIIKHIRSMSKRKIEESEHCFNYIALAVLNALFHEVEVHALSCTSDDNSVNSLNPIFCEELFTVSNLTTDYPLTDSFKSKLIASVVRIIMKTQTKFLQVFLSHFDLSEGHVDVILSCLRDNARQGSFEGDSFLLSRFFEAFTESKYLQTTIMRDSSFVSLMPVDALMNGLLEHLYMKELPSEIKSVIPMTLLLQFLEDNFTHKSEQIVDNLVRFLTQMENSVENHAVKSFEYFCNSLSECISLKLLSSEKCEDEALGILVRSFGYQLIVNPSNRVPLSLLSASLRAVADFDASKESLSQDRVQIAFNLVIEMAVEQIEMIDFVKDTIHEKENTFKRLAPLLILRCIPQGRNNRIREKTLKLSPVVQRKLLKLIINNIGIDSDWAQTSAHEKKLFTEIAVRYLPFHGCIYDMITSIFTTLDIEVKNKENSHYDKLKDMIKKTKLWIYGSCHFVTLDPENCSVPEFLKVINKAISLSDMDINCIASEYCMEDWIQLQMGCVELVSLYMKMRSSYNSCK